MSNSVTFEFHTNLASEHLLKNIRKLWHNKNASTDIYPGTKDSSLICELSYYHGDPEQKVEILDVVEYLFSVISDDELFYHRCSSTMIGCVDHSSPISVDDILVVV